MADLDVYYQCLRKEYYDKSIEPLLEVLYSLVICYERGISEGSYVNLFMDDDSINEVKVQIFLLN